MQHTIRTLAAIALAAGGGLALAQAGHTTRSPYYLNHQGATSGSMAAHGTDRALHEDLDGSVISTDDAVQLCDRLSNARRRQDCVSSVSSDDSASAGRDELHDDGGARAPSDDSQPGR